jgi:hypothetical protein
MATPDPTPRSAAADPTLRDALMELVEIGLRIARVAAVVAEADGQIIAVASTGLPEHLKTVGSLHDVQMAGCAVDTADTALKQASIRVAETTQSFERAARAVRRTVALIGRLDAGWPRRSRVDDRQAMARRQIARTVGERIARHAYGEAAERLFDDLHEKLDGLEADGGLDGPAGDVIAAICRDLGLTAQAATDIAGDPSPAAAERLEAAQQRPVMTKHPRHAPLHPPPPPRGRGAAPDG